jgi:hypothetical protein
MLQMFYLDVAKVDRDVAHAADGCRCCWGVAVGQSTWVSPCGARGHDANAGAAQVLEPRQDMTSHLGVPIA